MSVKGRGGPISLAALVGAMVGFAISPVPMFFDLEWLAWALVPAFAVVGAIMSMVFLAMADK